MDITDVILNDHDQQRRMFAYLDDIDRSNTDSLDAVWTRLRIALEVHAEAEERLFYPHLLKIGTGAGGEDSAAEEVTDVIKDHNEIRDAIKEAAKHAVGSENWWKAVAKTEEANSDHMAEEEREDLPTSAITPTGSFATRSPLPLPPSRRSTPAASTPKTRIRHATSRTTVDGLTGC